MINNTKKDRILSEIKKDIVEIISQDINSPKLGFITITEVKVSSDLSYATIYISFLNKKDERDSIDLLNKAKGFIRSELAHRLKTRRVPQLTFEVDRGFEKEQKIEELLKK